MNAASAAGALSARKQETVTVGLGEMRVVKDRPVVLTCLGLGSCVGVAAYDPAAKVAGMAHFVLPTGTSANGRGGVAKYVDRGVPRLLAEMEKQGAWRGRTVVKIAGGAQMALNAPQDPIFKIGERNVSATRETLRKENMRIAASDTGGNRGRTLRLDAATGGVTITVAGSATRKL